MNSDMGATTIFVGGRDLGAGRRGVCGEDIPSPTDWKFGGAS